MNKKRLKIKGCTHNKRAVSSSNCSFCKAAMMVMPKKKITNYKTKDKHIDWNK